MGTVACIQRSRGMAQVGSGRRATVGQHVVATAGAGRVPGTILCESRCVGSRGRPVEDRDHRERDHARHGGDRSEAADAAKTGIRIAIDDFGTGYSSLSYLRHFPVNTLKIDRSFVGDIRSDSADASIINAIAAMAHGLKLDLIAEGVENAHADEIPESPGLPGSARFHLQPTHSRARIQGAVGTKSVHEAGPFRP